MAGLAPPVPPLGGDDEDLSYLDNSPSTKRMIGELADLLVREHFCEMSDSIRQMTFDEADAKVREVVARYVTIFFNEVEFPANEAGGPKDAAAVESLNQQMMIVNTRILGFVQGVDMDALAEGQPLRPGSPMIETPRLNRQKAFVERTAIVLAAVCERS